MANNLLSLANILILVVAGVAAGISGAVSGLASIFSFPALIFIGVPPIAANMTNSVSLTALSLGSIPASYPEWKAHRDVLKRLWFPVLAGGVVGAVALLLTPGASFSKIAAVLIMFASVMIFIPKKTGETSKPKRFWLLGLILFAVGIYCGYFGAGAGSISMAASMFILGVDLKVASSIKNVLLGIANTMGVLIFAFSGQVQWLTAIPLAAGFYIGGRIGPVIVRHANQNVLRWFVSLFGICVAVAMLLR